MPPFSTLLTEPGLSNPPSVLDGTLTLPEEACYRSFGAELISECGIQLSLPQVVIATAQVFFQRFYHRCSFRDVDAHHLAMGALFLAGKVEECHRRMRPIINVCFAAKQRRERLLGVVVEAGGGGSAAAAGAAPSPPAASPRTTITLGGEVYSKWKLALMRCERLILKELGFQVYQGVSQEHAHKFLLYFVRVLDGDAPLAQTAWNILNDSLRLDLCVRYPPEALACAAIALAAQRRSFPLPTATPWYEVFGASKEVLGAISAAMLGLYEGPPTPIGWLPSKRPDWGHSDDNE